MSRSFAFLFLIAGVGLGLAASSVMGQTIRTTPSTDPLGVLRVPDAVVLVSPPQNWWYLIGGGMGDSVKFVWRSQPGISRYEWNFALDSLFALMLCDSVITDTVKVAPANQLFHLNYPPYWRTRARNSEGWGAWSDVRRIHLAITAVDDEPVPRGFVLGQNFPNPFNPSTTIRYGIPARSHVNLAVYDPLGQRVAQLVNGEVDAGFHEVRFDAAGLPSGVYFYRIQAGSYAETKKLILAK